MGHNRTLFRRVFEPAPTVEKLAFAYSKPTDADRFRRCRREFICQAKGD